MRETLVIIFFIVAFIVSVGWANFEKTMRIESELKRKGVVNHIDRIWFVKGIHDIKEGSRVSLFLYQDRVTINDSTIILLNKVTIAKTYKINEMRITNKLAAPNTLLRWGWFRRIWALLFLLSNMRVRNFLSIEFRDKQDNDCIGLFIADNRRSIKTFADGINKQTGAIVDEPGVEYRLL